MKKLFKGYWIEVLCVFIAIVAVVYFMSHIASSSVAETSHVATYGVTGSALTVYESGKSFDGQIIAPPVKLNGICVIQVKPAGAKDDEPSYQALMACSQNPTKGDKVKVVDYIISMPRHLSDMVHLAEKIP